MTSSASALKHCWFGGNQPEIGDVDEGIVERGEDSSNAKDELACINGSMTNS